MSRSFKVFEIMVNSRNNDDSYPSSTLLEKLTLEDKNDINSLAYYIMLTSKAWKTNDDIPDFIIDKLTSFEAENKLTETELENFKKISIHLEKTAEETPAIKKRKKHNKSKNRMPKNVVDNFKPDPGNIFLNF